MKDKALLNYGAQEVISVTLAPADGLDKGSMERKVSRMIGRWSHHITDDGVDSLKWRVLELG